MIRRGGWRKEGGKTGVGGQGIGGTLETIVGNVRRAPWLFRVVGLEWFYRLLKEPGRLRRQMALPRFALQILKQRLRS